MGQRRVCLLLLATLLAACSEETIAYECTAQTNCTQSEIPGVCRLSTESESHWCAYPDAVCESGQRWGVLAGDGLASQCVEAEPVDAGRLDAAADGAPLADAGLDGGPEPIDAGIIDASLPDAFACEADAFVACLPGGVLQRCNSTGTDLIEQSCGAPGCNAAAGRCNECIPSSATCSGTVLNTCSAAGLDLLDTACTYACVPTAGNTKAHCAFVDPAYLPGICDATASTPELVVSASTTFDTSNDATCNGGIRNQSDGASICVLRYGTFRIIAGRMLTVVGDRALAIVTDGKLEIVGHLDVSAAGGVHGPGGGTLVSGEGPIAVVGGGGGGAGFAQSGAAGGGAEAGTGKPGGASFKPTTLEYLIGGPAADVGSLATGSGGGGGGAVTLVSCRGEVAVTGAIDAGGGGGAPGTRVMNGNLFVSTGAGGGGAGGHVLLQGLAVSVTGKVYANGGGGGGATSMLGMGNQGVDGATSLGPAAGGAGVGTGGAGGNGGSGNTPPGEGKAGNGGGGGSMGYFQALVPAGVTPTVAPSQASPAFSPSGQVGTK